jgi:nicotinate-nucleotide--dimethylbenzimidazole phosphoribosyltransferase
MVPLRGKRGKATHRSDPLASPYTDLQRNGTGCGGRPRCAGIAPRTPSFALPSMSPESNAPPLAAAPEDDIMQTPSRELGFDPIEPADAGILRDARARLDTLTKPLGALGRLEDLAARVCAAQATLDPKVLAPIAIVFAGDHGIADRGVSAYPKAVTAQMVANFLAGGAAISVLARSEGLALWIVDAGVAGECGRHAQLIDAKMAAGTRDFSSEPAMTPAELREALKRGRVAFERARSATTNTLILGEMGIGNTASAALLMHGLTGLPLAACVGRGTGLDDAGLERKRAVLAGALVRRAPPAEPLELLAEFGGYEIVMLTGAMLAAAARRTLLLVDGFTVTVAAAFAARLAPAVLDYCIFSHRSAEQAHGALLEHLGARPLLDLGMRLGEGSGAALALPLVRAALDLYGNMATFESAGVSEKRP